MPQRIIFLDIDGVLIPSSVWAHKTKKPFPRLIVLFFRRIMTHLRDVIAQEVQFKEQSVTLINQVTKTCGARIVINSNWPLTMGRRRTFGRLKQAGLDTELLHKDWHINLRGVLKSLGITLWIKAHPPVHGIIVDDSEFERHAKRLGLANVRVDRNRGLSESDAETIRRIFEGKE
ncbi:MAG: HAD domain-containing protein [Desulfovibrionales bacterium]